MKWLDAHEERAWRGYRRLLTLLEAQLARDLEADSGLSMPDYEVLTTVSEAPDGAYRLTALASRMRWSTSRLSHHVSRMERRGLVFKATTDEDGRAVIIRLTDHGRDRLRTAAPKHVASVRRHLVDCLTATQLDALDEICRTVVGRLEEVT